MTTDAPRQAVFGTNELLEQIILSLPMQKIFGIQRVCRQFRDVIATSPKIQEKMFLRLRKDVPEETWKLDIFGKSLGNRLKPEEDVRFEKVVDIDSVKTEAALFRPVVLNPLFSLMPRDVSSKQRRYYAIDNHESITMDFSQSHFGDHPSFLKTYITDPPCYFASAAMETYFLLGPTQDLVPGTVSGHWVLSDQGLTIGNVLLAHTEATLQWGRLGHPNRFYSDSQLEEIIRDVDSSATGEGSSPKLTLELLGLIIPTEEEWKAVSSEHEEVTP